MCNTCTAGLGSIAEGGNNVVGCSSTEQSPYQGWKCLVPVTTAASHHTAGQSSLHTHACSLSLALLQPKMETACTCHRVLLTCNAQKDKPYKISRSDCNDATYAVYIYRTCWAIVSQHMSSDVKTEAYLRSTWRKAFKQSTISLRFSSIRCAPCSKLLGATLG